MTSHSAHANGHISLDYHLHSNVSCDTQATMAEMCRAALGRGITEIAFTEHFDLHPLDYCVNFYKPDDYFEKLENARRVFAPQGLTIRAGVEIGEYHLYHETVKPVLDACPYDLVLGSLHWVGNDSVFDPAYFRAHTPQDAIAPYFAELLNLVRFGGFDVLSHPDVFKRVAYTVYGQYNAGEWEDLIRPVWQACIEQGIGIELNTSALRREVGQPHPSLEALRWYREMGGDRLTVGSDGHQPDHVGYGLATAHDMARAAGFTRLCCFEKRQIVRWIEI